VALAAPPAELHERAISATGIDERLKVSIALTLASPAGQEDADGFEKARAWA
jgi:hypothetical protein